VILTTDGGSNNNEIYTKYNEVLDDKKQLQKTLEIMKNYIKYEQDIMMNKRNQIAKSLEDRERELLYQKEENRIIINENKELKNTIFRILHQVKLFEDAEAAREKEINVRIIFKYLVFCKSSH
jgi:hypothetical protein